MDHIRYEVEINFQGNITKIYVAVSKEVPDELHDKVILNEVFDYFKRTVKLSYIQNLF